MVDSIVSISSNGLVKVIISLMHRHFRLNALQIILELLNGVILGHHFNCMLKSLALLLQFIAPDCFLDQRDVWGEIVA